MIRPQRSVRRDDNPDRPVNPRKLVDRRDVFDIPHACAAVLHRENNSKQPNLGKFLDRSQRKLTRLVPLHDIRSDLALSEFAHTLLQLRLFFVKLEIQDVLQMECAWLSRAQD